MAAKKKTLYDVLGVARDASPLDVGLAYQQRIEALQRAPVQDASELALVRNAHEVLLDPKRRAAYDATLVTESEKAAAKEQAAPDIVLDAEDEEGKRRIPPVGIGIAIVVVLIIAIFAWKSLRTPPAPAVEAAAEAPAPAPAPVVERKKSAQDILTQAQASVARLQSFAMLSGRAVPVGLAVATEPAAMITTCHGIPAGSQLVATIGPDNHSATLNVTDEQLDLCRILIAPPVVPVLPVSTEEPRPGDAIYVLGANASGDLALTEGTVQALMPDARGRMLQLSMPVAPNASGGAVFDAYGKLIGIATTSHGHGASVSLAIPVAWIGQMRSRPSAQPQGEPAATAGAAEPQK
jgi:hypothetical protein